jgi:succinate dehydrogenase flavin-adding protein (antitoxin of CptAB toxin-antitoxin module)
MYLQLHGLGSASEQELKEHKRLLEASQSDLFDVVSFHVTPILWYL